MESKIKLFGLMVLSLMVGIGAGFYYGNKTDGSKAIEVTNQEKETTSVVANVSPDANKKNLALQKLSLLKNYTDFIFLFPEKIGDADKYINAMKAKIVEINDNEIISKFNSSWEIENGEQKRLDFLDYLNESIQADLR